MVRSGAYRCHTPMLTDCWGRSLTSFPQLIRGHSSKWCLSKVPRCRVELWGHLNEGQNCSVHPRQEDSVVSETQTMIMYSDQQNHPWGLTPHLTPHQSSHLNVNTLRMQIISSLLLSSGPRSCNHIPATELAFCVEGRDLIAEITL